MTKRPDKSEESIDRISKVLAVLNRDTTNNRFGLLCEQKVNGIGGTTKSQSIDTCISKLTQIYDQFVKPVIKLRELELTMDEDQK